MLSIIICSINEAKFQNVRQDYARLLSGVPHEIIRISDAKGLSEGYNRGVKQAKYDQLLFSHDDIEIVGDDFQAKLLSRLAKFHLLGIAGATRVTGPRWIDAGPPYIFGQVTHAVQDGSFFVDMYNNTQRVFTGMKIIDGVFMATHKRVLEKCPFDADYFGGFHFYDMDFSFRAHLAGFSVAVCSDLGVIHHSSGNYNENWMAEADRFLMKYNKHLSPVITSKFRWAGASVPNRNGVKLLINPDYWTPFESPTK